MPRAKANPLLWMLILGAVGLFSGYFGPLAFSPDANQGPLLGIFVTGPRAAILGLLLGALVRFVAPLNQAKAYVLGAACIGVCGATLYASMPDPEFRGRIVDAQVNSCAVPSRAVDSALAYWNARIAPVTWAAPRAGWKEELRDLARTDPGVVIEMRVLRARDVYVNRKPWNRGSLVRTPWQAEVETKRYYARFSGSDCSDYLVAPRALYFPASEHETVYAWPPRGLPNLLDLLVLDAVPQEYESLTVEQ